MEPTHILHPFGTADPRKPGSLPADEPHRAEEHAASRQPEDDGRGAFDFWEGRWNVHNRRLRERLKGSQVWDEFPATCVCRSLLGGLANEDEYRTSHWPDFMAMAFRFFNPETRLWAIYWVTNQQGVLEPPVYGSFVGDVGVFDGDDRVGEVPIRVRFIWSGVAGPQPRWQQAFSADGGQTWETNWIMEMTREGKP